MWSILVNFAWESSIFEKFLIDMRWSEINQKWVESKAFSLSIRKSSRMSFVNFITLHSLGLLKTKYVLYMYCRSLQVIGNWYLTYIEAYMHIYVTHLTRWHSSMLLCTAILSETYELHFSYCIYSWSLLCTIFSKTLSNGHERLTGW